jgi:hypothetical protein
MQRVTTGLDYVLILDDLGLLRRYARLESRMTILGRIASGYSPVPS